MESTNSLSIENLSKHYPVRSGIIFSKRTDEVKAVNDISFEIKGGETFGLVGESGCGKSTTAKMILGLEVPTSGKIRFNGQNIFNYDRNALFRFRRKIQAVFQDPYRSLNPRKKVKAIIAEPMLVHKTAGKSAIFERVAELMELVGLNPGLANSYPHEFSGGQRQRIAIARALSLKPEVIILDEPVSALDVSIQAQILNLLKDIQEKFKLAYLIISHDLAIVEHVSTHIGVMYLGKLVEKARADELYSNPIHPYTRALIDSVPVADPKRRRQTSIEGDLPSPLNLPSGCAFHTRCQLATSACAENDAEMTEIAPEHWVSCKAEYNKD
mgnify:CR=1 FL=1